MISYKKGMCNERMQLRARLCNKAKIIDSIIIYMALLPFKHRLLKVSVIAHPRPSLTSAAVESTNDVKLPAVDARDVGVSATFSVADIEFDELAIGIWL